MTRKECLDAAGKAVLTDRAREHGHPEDCFGLIAALWSRYTGCDISTADVAAMMILLKLARVEGNPRHMDSWVDIAGYAACGAECATGMSGCERVGGVDYGTVSVPEETTAADHGHSHGGAATSGNTKLMRHKVDDDLYRRLLARVSEAQEKHPDFADGIYQGVGVIGEEYGELCQALNKMEGEGRVMDEALDLLCVVWRFCRGDWRQEK